MQRYARTRAARWHSVAPRAGWLPIVLLLALLGAGCDLNVTGSAASPPPSVALQRADTAPTPLPTAQLSSSTAAQDCPVTEPTIATPPTAVPGGRDPLSRGPYYVSVDRQVWAQDWGWTSTPGTRKVLWLKPLKAPLELRGQRLDAKAPPLRISSGGDDQFDYRASHLTFPTEGCWEIVAQSSRACCGSSCTSTPYTSHRDGTRRGRPPP